MKLHTTPKSRASAGLLRSRDVASIPAWENPKNAHFPQEAGFGPRRDYVLREAIGQHIFERLTAAQIADWDEYSLQVTDWKKKRYFDVL
jgi:hypothetical protein